MSGTADAKTWATEWAAQKAAQALEYLGRNFPEGLENPRILDEHEATANAAALRGDREGYLKALRAYMMAGRAEGLRIRRGRHKRLGLPRPNLAGDGQRFSRAEILS